MSLHHKRTSDPSVGRPKVVGKGIWKEGGRGEQKGLSVSWGGGGGQCG